MGGISHMDKFIDIISAETVIDGEGFSKQRDVVISRVRAQKKDTAGGSENYKSGAAFTNETAEFCFRRIPDITVTTAMYIADDTGRYNITKVDGESGRGMYVNVTASLITPSKG